MPHNVSVVIEHDSFGYYAYAPELEGCQSQGDTLAEVTANIDEAIGESGTHNHCRGDSVSRPYRLIADCCPYLTHAGGK